MSVLDELRDETRTFAAARDWFQFHTPKNLAMAIAGEAGELVAEFQWLTEDESAPDALTRDRRSAIQMEMADVFIYLLRLSDVLDIDLGEAARDKLEMNQNRFPVVSPSDLPAP
jgi:NTP pyrophosphatase (non-canonical NTP hydrolase)